MTEFHDSTGRSWALTLTIGSAKDIYDRTGVDLLNPTSLIRTNEEGIVDENSVIFRFYTDDLFVSDIISNLVEKQAKERGMSKEDVLNLLDGETCKKAYDAFMKEYRNFFTARGNVQGKKMVDMILQGLQSLAEELNGEKSSNSQDVQDSQTSAS